MNGNNINQTEENDGKIKWLCDECGTQIGWIITDKDRYHRQGLSIDSYAVEEDTGRELCPDCFRKTPEGREYL
jgi:hypothetical protein